MTKINLNESLFEAVNSLGVERPDTYKKRQKPLSILAFDSLEKLGYNVFASREGNGYEISKRNEKNLQKAKDLCDTLNLDYSVKPFRDRYYMTINIPKEDDATINSYFRSTDRAMAEKVTTKKGFNKLNKYLKEDDNTLSIEDKFNYLKSYPTYSSRSMSDKAYTRPCKVYDLGLTDEQSDEFFKFLEDGGLEAFWNAHEYDSLNIYQEGRMGGHLILDPQVVDPYVFDEFDSYEEYLQDYLDSNYYPDLETPEGDLEYSSEQIENATSEVNSEISDAYNALVDFDNRVDALIRDLKGTLDKRINGLEESIESDRYVVVKYSRWLYSILDNKTNILVRKPGKEDIIDKAYDENGKTVFFTTKSKEEAQAFADKLNGKSTKKLIEESVEGDKIAQDYIDSKNDNFEKDKQATRDMRQELAKQGVATNEQGQPITESVQKVKNILQPLVTKDGKVRALKDSEKLPRGFRFKSGNGTSGEVSYKGTDYAYAIVNGKLKVMTSAEAGDNWSETIYKESIENVYQMFLKTIEEYADEYDLDLDNLTKHNDIIPEAGDYYRAAVEDLISLGKKWEGYFGKISHTVLDDIKEMVKEKLSIGEILKKLKDNATEYLTESFKVVNKNGKNVSNSETIYKEYYKYSGYVVYTLTLVDDNGNTYTEQDSIPDTEFDNNPNLDPVEYLQEYYDDRIIDISAGEHINETLLRSNNDHEYKVFTIKLKDDNGNIYTEEEKIPAYILSANPDLDLKEYLKDYYYDEILEVTPSGYIKNEALDNIQTTVDKIFSSGDEGYPYAMLDRMKSDCEYYLGYGNRSSKYLWGKEPKQHIEIMKAIYNRLDPKPEWLTIDKINEYEKNMLSEPLEYDSTFKNDNFDIATPQETANAFNKSVVDGNKKYNPQNESFEDEHLGEVTTTETTPETPAVGPELGIAGVINSLIIDEFEAIDGYNSAIATAEEEGMTDIVNVLKDIANEENLHVGQLQTCLAKVSPNAKSIDDGQVEAESQISSNDSIVTEDLNNNITYIRDNSGKIIRAEDKNGKQIKLGMQIYRNGMALYVLGFDDKSGEVLAGDKDEKNLDNVRRYDINLLLNNANQTHENKI